MDEVRLGNLLLRLLLLAHIERCLCLRMEITGLLLLLLLGLLGLQWDDLSLRLLLISIGKACVEGHVEELLLIDRLW